MILTDVCPLIAYGSHYASPVRVAGKKGCLNQAGICNCETNLLCILIAPCPSHPNLNKFGSPFPVLYYHLSQSAANISDHFLKLGKILIVKRTVPRHTICQT